MLYISGLEGGEQITLFDVSGRLIVNKIAAVAIESISTADLPAGTYIVKISNGINEKTIQIVVTK